MDHLIQATFTFLYLKESQVNIEEGEEKEFLRGTFSLMDFDQRSTSSLDELKARFMKFKKELGGLEEPEFEEALRSFTASWVSENQIRTVFRKMDTCDQGAVSWSEFMNFAIEEHSKRIQLKESMDEMPFSSDVVRVKHHHSDPVTRISFMPHVDPNTKVVDWNVGKFMILSREGVMSVWTGGMKCISYNNLNMEARHQPPWYLDMVCMYHNGFIAVITTSRDIAFYDFTRRGWMRKYHVLNLDKCASCLNYWAGMETEQKAVLLCGDTSGSVIMLEFDLADLTPMFGIAVREGCSSFYWSDILKGLYPGTTAKVFPRVHQGWVKQVSYVPEINSILSCCIDADTAMYMSHVEPTKKTPTYFNVIRGILCFDHSHQLNLMACAGMDSIIWLFNPYIPNKVVAAMEGHIRPVIHLKINETEKYSISVDMSKTIIIFSLSSQAVIQRIPGQSVRMGNYPINTIYLHTQRRMCVLGSHSIAMLRRHRLDDEIKVDVRSHDFKLVGALYSPEFEQVVSVCRGSMVRVWDLNTGTRVMQFDKSHVKKSQGKWIPVEIECIALTENRRRLMTAAEGVVKIWNFNTGSVLRNIDMSNCQRITSIVMAKKLIYVTGWHKLINVFSDFKGEEAIKKTWAMIHNADCLALCVMEPNLIASSGYDGAINLWSRETTDAYCKLHATFGPKPELNTSVRSTGNKSDNIMHAAADLEAAEEDEEEKGEDAFMTIGLHLPKISGWYRGLRALKKKQIERERRRAAAERKDFSARYKKKKKRMNLQGLSLIYESAVECMVFLGSRKYIDPQTATLVVGGAECWIRFWSVHPKGGLLGQFNCARRKLESILCLDTDKENEYLFAGDSLGFLRIFDIKEFCNVDKLSQEDREQRNKRLKKEFVYTRLPFKSERMLDTMEKLREKKVTVPDASKPRQNLKAPRLLSSIRAHSMAITSLEFIEERNVILTASHDLTVRLWTKNCTYIGTFGELWKPIPKVVGAVVQKVPSIPRDILRCASALSLATLHNGHMPHWKQACYVVRRHIHEQKREKQIEETRQKMKEEKRARGEAVSDEEDTAGGDKPVSTILGKHYQPKRYYLGPMTMEAQGLPRLIFFRGRCSPYHSAPPKDIHCTEPLYRPPTFFDIDTRRTGHKSKRATRHMMNILNVIACDPTRYTARGLSSAVSASTLYSRRTVRSIYTSKASNFNTSRSSKKDDFISMDSGSNQDWSCNQRRIRQIEREVSNYKYMSQSKIHNAYRQMAASYKGSNSESGGESLYHHGHVGETERQSLVKEKAESTDLDLDFYSKRSIHDKTHMKHETESEIRALHLVMDENSFVGQTSSKHGKEHECALFGQRHKPQGLGQNVLDKLNNSTVVSRHLNRNSSAKPGCKEKLDESFSTVDKGQGNSESKPITYQHSSPRERLSDFEDKVNYGSIEETKAGFLPPLVRQKPPNQGQKLKYRII